MQICRETAEHPYGLRIPSSRHSDPVLCVADIDAGSIVIDLRKSIQRPAPSLAFAIELPPSQKLTDSARVPSV
jgi:hypothetical protein